MSDGARLRCDPLVLLPAVDVASGQAVRLAQGAADSQSGAGDPLDTALEWQNAGAKWVHLVDLDAAFGRGSNTRLLASVVARLRTPVQLSGGIRDDSSLAAALATGCARAVISAAALASPAWVRDAVAAHGERIAIGLDVRAGRLAARGVPRGGSADDDLLGALAWLERAGCARFVVTDVTRDGTMAGPNLDLLRQVCARTRRPVLASGGVASLADLRALAALRPLGVEGAVVGKALYAGAFTLPQALEAVRG